MSQLESGEGPEGTDDHDDLTAVEDESSLIRRARDGDDDAYAELFARHHRAALNYARSIAGANEAEDLVAEAFAKLLSALRRDLGPATSFRPYLLTSIRRLWANTLRSRARYDIVEDIAGAADRLNSRTATDGDNWHEDAIAAAFRRLPERWREVLWLGNVDGYSQAEIARQLDIKPNAVSALSFRAREGLRREYLAQHLSAAKDPGCQDAIPLLPAYVRGTLDRRKIDRAASHLENCAGCSAAASDLRAISDNLAVALPALAAGGWLIGEHVSAHTAVPPRDLGARGAAWSARRLMAGTTAAGVIAAVTVLVWPHSSRPAKTPIAAPHRTPTIQITDLGPAPRPRPPRRPLRTASPRPPTRAPAPRPTSPPPSVTVPPAGNQGTSVTGTADGPSPGPVHASVP